MSINQGIYTQYIARLSIFFALKFTKLNVPKCAAYMVFSLSDANITF